MRPASYKILLPPESQVLDPKRRIELVVVMDMCQLRLRAVGVAGKAELLLIQKIQPGDPSAGGGRLKQPRASFLIRGPKSNRPVTTR
jgi:hypothetical protein